MEEANLACSTDKFVDVDSLRVNGLAEKAADVIGRQ